MVDPRILTEAVEPPYASSGATNRLLAEVWDHLWPWSRNGFQRQRMIQAAGLALAIAASLAWVLAAMGNMTPYPVLSALNLIANQLRHLTGVTAGLELPPIPGPVLPSERIADEHTAATIALTDAALDPT